MFVLINRFMLRSIACHSLMKPGIRHVCLLVPLIDTCHSCHVMSCGVSSSQSVESATQLHSQRTFYSGHRLKETPTAMQTRGTRRETWWPRSVCGAQCYSDNVVTTQRVWCPVLQRQRYLVMWIQYRPVWMRSSATVSVSSRCTICAIVRLSSACLWFAVHVITSSIRCWPRGQSFVACAHTTNWSSDITVCRIWD